LQHIFKRRSVREDLKEHIEVKCDTKRLKDAYCTFYYIYINI
jgi:hypothetical protein